MFWVAAGATLAMKMLLAAVIPITSDEAYFVVWAQHPDYGYYDHPPMIGWLLRFMLLAGRSEIFLRMPAILSTVLIGIGIYLLLRRTDEEKACLVGTLFLASPLNLFNVLVTTDTPMIFLGFASALLFYLAPKKEGYSLYILSGAALGLAFLSKYFAAILGFVYLVYFLLTPKTTKKTAGFILLALSALPFVFVNLHWNYTHSWANLMFNFFNRNRKEEFSLLKPLIYLVSQAYLMTPPLVYYLVKKRRELTGKMTSSPDFRFFAILFACALLLFLPMSFRKVIGLHWVLTFYPFLYIAAFFVMNRDEFYRSMRFMLGFSFVHLFVVAILLALPPGLAKRNRNYNAIVMGVHSQSVVDSIKPYEKEFTLATGSYADSAVMSYHYGKYFLVFGAGSYHGRQDDLITDFRKLNGGNILVLAKSPPNMENFGQYFKRVEVRQFTVHGAVFHIVLGCGFEYETYRDTVLKGIKEKYYNIPPWLPLKADYFSQKYF